MALTLSLGMWAAVLVHAQSSPATHGRVSFDAKTAAAALDSDMNWWLSWPNAARDHDTQCVSCHSVVPYVLARPKLHVASNDAPSDAEQRLWANVVKRVNLWSEVAPFYPDQTVGVPKTSESRGTESVLNALILSTRDAGKGTLSDEAKTALANMWALQMRTGPQNGAWTWINFHYEPFESDNSPFFGAALALEAVGVAPNYAGGDEARDGLQRLRKYIAANFDTQNLVNRATMAMAARRMPDVITAAQRATLAADMLKVRNEDGGWSTGRLGDYKRVDNTPLDTASDGYGTALAILALDDAHDAAAQSAAAKARAWLVAHQQPSGGWLATSLNKNRDPKSNPARFMITAATGYAIVALSPR